MNNRTFYLVWWTEHGASPESQLMGIYDSQESAQSIVEKYSAFKGENDKVYVSIENTDDNGECL